MSETKFEVTTERVGFFEERATCVVHMPREMFLDIVTDTLESSNRYEPIRDEMLATARVVPRFPVNTWVNPTSGCGCLVGEYLIATQEIREFNQQIADLDLRRAAVEEYMEIGVHAMLEKREHASDLMHFGYAINDAIQAAIGGEVFVDRKGIDTVVIDD